MRVSGYHHDRDHDSAADHGHHNVHRDHDSAADHNDLHHL